MAKTHTLLAHANRAATLGELTASIAHEVNQPLSGVITNSSTCLRMLADEPPNIEGARETADATGTIPINESGWCVLRAWSDKAEYPVMDNYTYATTSPVYVILGGKRAYSKKDAEYFKAWIDRVVEITDEYPDWNSAREKAYVMKKLREARAVYQTLQ